MLGAGSSVHRLQQAGAPISQAGGSLQTVIIQFELRNQGIQRDILRSHRYDIISGLQKSHPLET